MSSGDLPQQLQGREAFAAKARELVRAARHELLLRSDTLDRALYGSEEFYNVVKDFLLGSERARLLVLVRQPQAGLQNAPRLIDLGQRISSRVEFREPGPEQGEIDPAEWLIADRRGLLERRGLESLESLFWAEEPQRGKLRAEEFDGLWNEAQPAQELRNLGI
jgi:hypothetical protein